MNRNYPYSDGDLLSNPQTYRYTEFQGDVFVQAWRESRQAVCAELPLPALPALNASARASVTEVSGLLEQICLTLRAKPLTDDAQGQYWLPRLLKKFEVSKRLHTGYERVSPHRALPGSGFLALTPYLLLAECMIHGWRSTSAGYYLNALLKLNDTLISQRARLDKDQAAYLAWILANEQHLITELST
ncbi:hypothetical protein [Pseudomonas asplenii]|uniref:hypothetical protein n=1 Tax=Pseudomonas asplenii TaxID=53407 RepID=UPI00035F41D2|nr:hypothetical protein [Pseudomonas fuscovaginae]